MTKLITFKERDRENFRNYGANAPHSEALLFINEKDISNQVVRFIPREKSGSIIGGDWDQEVIAITSSTKWSFCYKHFVEGLSWEQAGVVDYFIGSARNGNPMDRLITLDDIFKRYSRLDELYRELLAGANLVPLGHRKSEYGLKYRDGIYVHFDRECKPLFGLAGFHRLAISKILGLGKIPVQLGVVHELAIRSGKWHRYYESARR